MKKGRKYYLICWLPFFIWFIMIMYYLTFVKITTMMFKIGLISMPIMVLWVAIFSSVAYSYEAKDK